MMKDDKFDKAVRKNQSNLPWTDHNPHDPGITLLEHLSYAISDLSYRLGFKIEDLLAEKELPNVKAFYQARTILPQAPLSLLDYRKLLLDQAGVKNAWIRIDKQPSPPLVVRESVKDYVLEIDKQTSKNPRYVKGVLEVLIEPHDSDKSFSTEKVKDMLSSNRNLCEWVQKIRVLEPEPVDIILEVEVKAQAEFETVYHAILKDLQQWISPNIQFYTLQEMLDKGKQIEEIFHGPRLDHGFLDDEEVRQFDKRTSLRASDILHRLMDMELVKVVRSMMMSGLIQTNQTQYLTLDEDRVPRLSSLEVKFFVNNKAIAVVKKDSPFFDEEEDVIEEEETQAETTAVAQDLTPPKGRYRNPAHFYSIAHDLPQNYGIGLNGLPAKSNKTRKAQAKQLKAYLAIFEQILANYFAQLDHVKNIFSLDYKDWKSYASQSVGLEDGISDFEELLKEPDHYPNSMANAWDDYDSKTDRLLRLTKHLLARFAEDWPEPPYLKDTLKEKGRGPTLLKKKPDMGSISIKPVELPQGPIKPWQPNLPEIRPWMPATWKKIEQQRDFLQAYPELGYTRARAFDYTHPDSGTDPNNISGFEQRLKHLLGIATFDPNRYPDIEVEYYQELDTDQLDEYRFRIKNKETGKIVLSSSMHYHDMDHARAELMIALRLTAKDESFELRTTEEKKKRYYFNIIDASGEVIARRIEYFSSRKKRNAVIAELKKLCKSVSDTEYFYLLEHFLIGPQEKDVHAIFKPFWKLSNKRGRIGGVKEKVEVKDGVDGIHFPAVSKVKKETGLLEAVVDASAAGMVIDPIVGTKEYYIKSVFSDPWSLQLSLVLPENVGRFTDLLFRDYVNDFINATIPAHLTPSIKWLDAEKMASFEANYLSLRKKLASGLNPFEEKVRLGRLLGLPELAQYIDPEAYLQLSSMNAGLLLPENSFPTSQFDKDTEFTISFWAKIEEVTLKSYPLIEITNKGKRLLGVEFKNRFITFQCGTAKLSLPVSKEVHYDQWVHWTFVNRKRKGFPDHIGIYVNGEEVMSLAKGGMIAVREIEEFTFKIVVQSAIDSGKQPTKDLMVKSAKMCLSDLRIYKALISENEIQKKKDHRLTIIDKNLHRYWKLDGGKDAVAQNPGKVKGQAIKIQNAEWKKHE